jgi:hypothetical protein
MLFIPLEMVSENPRRERQGGLWSRLSLDGHLMDQQLSLDDLQQSGHGAIERQREICRFV